MALSTREKVALGIVGIPVMLVVGTLWYGYVLATMWEWYVVPLGMKPINWAAASGLSGIVGTLRMGSYLRQDSKTTSRALMEVFACWLGYAMVLGIGRVLLNWAEWGPR